MITKEYKERVLNFDPSEIYSRCDIDKYKRVQSIPVFDLFPRTEYKVCMCGCGQKLTGRRYCWATDNCSAFATDVWGIITGRSNFIKPYMMIKFPEWKCCNCNSTLDIEIDHKIPVSKGGGGCWLDNYQLLCKRCHKRKTSYDYYNK